MKKRYEGHVVKGKKGFQEKPNLIRDLERELEKLKHNFSLNEIIYECEIELEKIKREKINET